MSIEKLIELLQKLPPGSVALDCTSSIFDHHLRESLDGHLKHYDGWPGCAIRIVSPAM